LTRILVFPGGMPKSLEFARRAEAEGHEVVGASSIPNDAGQVRYRDWAFLPMVTDDGFHAALAALLREQRIEAVFTPNAVVWHHLKATLASRHPGVALWNESPMDTDMAPYREARTFAARIASEALPLGDDAERRPPCEMLVAEAVFRHAETIPGMCDHEKIHALFEVFRSAPPGDVVEIGTAWGKSAFVLHALARHHGIGPVLCVDPWGDGNTRQDDEKGLVDSTRSTISMDEVFRVFLVNLPPYARGSMNYLRMTSEEAAPRYGASRVISSAEFGEVAFGGAIALLHVDGNHAYAAARADVQAWKRHLQPGGWLVVDDYVWPFGDGPKRAGDEFLAEHADAVDCAFVMGSALFVRVGAGFSPRASE
jgi:hypothetical protein